MIAPVEIVVEANESKPGSYSLLLKVGYGTHIALYDEFSSEEEAREQAEIYKKDIERNSKAWCTALVKDAVNVKWLVPALEGK